MARCGSADKKSLSISSGLLGPQGVELSDPRLGRILPNMARRSLLWGALALWACEAPEPAALDATVLDGGGAGDSGWDAGASDLGPGPDASDPSEALFARDHLVRVELTLDPADWDALRAQTRTLESTLARPECLDEPFTSPFSYFPAEVTIDGTRYPQVGLRKKGFLGSLSDTKPSLKLKFDEFVAGQEHLGLSSLTFNNSRQDPTLLRTCLGFDLFRRAGVPAPRCNYAEIYVNGQALGPYAHVEVINKRFLRRHFSDDEGQLYEGTVSDFRAGWLGTFEQETNEAVPYDRSDLAGLTAALDAPDPELLLALDPWLDRPAFLRFWAAEVLLDHWDGYSGNTNNFYVYADPSDGRFRFLPWGVDATLGTNPHEAPYSVMAVSALARRLYLLPEGRAEYLAELRRQLAESFDTTQILESIDQAARRIGPVIPPAERESARIATDRLRTYVRDRVAQVEAELNAGGFEWTTPLRDRLCFELGTVDAQLSTTFGTHPTDNPFATGTGSYTATIAGGLQRGQMVGAAAGLGTGPDDQGQVVLILAATLSDGSIPLLYVVLPPELLAPGSSLPIDGVRVRAALLRIPRLGQPIELVGGFLGGAVLIEAGAPTAAAPIRARVVGQIISGRP